MQEIKGARGFSVECSSEVFTHEFYFRICNEVLMLDQIPNAEFVQFAKVEGIQEALNDQGKMVLSTRMWR